MSSKRERCLDFVAAVAAALERAGVADTPELEAVKAQGESLANELGE